MSDSEEDSTEKQLKLIIVGEPNVGKTSIIRRFCYDEFTRQYNQTIGADFYIKRLMLPGRKDILIKITEIGGLELSGHMLENYLFNSTMIILVYDITSSASFEGMLLWIDSIAKFMEKPTFVAAFGNKCDLEHKRAVRLDKTQDFVDEFQLYNFLVSAKTGENLAVIRDIHTAEAAINEQQRQIKHLFDVVLNLKKDPEVIEKYTENIRFCIICNYLSKIIPALQSRCTRFRFGPLNSEQILPRLNYVVDEEKVTITEDGKKALLTLAKGDMRKVLNVLQSTWLAYKNVTEDNVYTCVGHPLRTDIENIVKWLLNEDFSTTYKNIKELKMIKGLALNDILTEVHTFAHRIEFPFDLLVNLLNKMAEIERRLSSGASENIQLTALIAAFQHAKDVHPPEGS